MAYEKQEWNCGDTITAEKMNHIEDGIEAASSGGSTEPWIIDIRGNTPFDEPTSNSGTTTIEITSTVTATLSEVMEAITSGRQVYVAYTYGEIPATIMLTFEYAVESVMAVFSGIRFMTPGPAFNGIIKIELMFTDIEVVLVKFWFGAYSPT